MKSSVSTIYKIFLISAFVILMSGITCEPETRSLDFKEVFRKKAIFTWLDLVLILNYTKR